MEFVRCTELLSDRVSAWGSVCDTASEPSPQTISGDCKSSKEAWGVDHQESTVRGIPLLKTVAPSDSAGSC